MSYISILIKIPCACVCVFVCSDLITGQTTKAIGFIFGIYILGTPGSVIGYINLISKVFKDFLWPKYFLCDVPLHF